MRLVICSNSVAFCAERPGSADGMYSRSPSSSRGRNSPPSRDSGQAVLAASTTAITSVAFGQRSTHSSAGR